MASKTKHAEVIDIVLLISEHKAELNGMTIDKIRQFVRKNIKNDVMISDRVLNMAIEKVGIEVAQPTRKRTPKGYRMADVAQAVLILVGEIERQVGIDPESISQNAKNAKRLLKEVVDARKSKQAKNTRNSPAPGSNGQHKNRLLRDQSKS